MKRSVKVAAKTVNIALIVVLVCAFGLAAQAALHPVVPKTYQKVLDRLPDLFASGLALAFVVALVSGFHIAVSAALERMRDKNTPSGPDT